MNNIYVINQDFNIEAVIDEYVSCIWRPSYSDIGDFELYVGASPKVLNLLKINHYLVRSSDVSVDDQGKSTYNKVMIIKNLELITDVENGDFIKVTGRELKYILHQRIIWVQTNLNGNVGDAIQTIINQNAINTGDTRRVIPNLVFGAATGITNNIKKQVTGSYLDETITDICNTYGYGWDIYVFDHTMTVRLYNGLDRSFNQTDIPYVVFSDSFDNLYNTNYQIQTENYANTALIGGEGEGAERKYAVVNNENSGLNRYEVFTDARDLSTNKGSEGEIPLEEYTELLRERGKENLAELQYTEGFSGEVLSDSTFKYGKDFDLGDIVTVINSYGISKNVRVLSAIESDDESGTKLIPQFNI